ncbi:MAG: tetratricopeptide repeat protein [Bacteroidota bacterium]
MKKSTILFFPIFLILLTVSAYSQKTAEDYLRLAYLKIFASDPDCQEAIQNCNKAIELKPDYEESYLCRGIAKAKLKDYRGAVLDYNKLIEIKPDDDGAYLNRGIVKFALGDLGGACVDWTKAHELGNFEASNKIKEYCKELLTKEELKKYLEEILEKKKAIPAKTAKDYFSRGTAKYLSSDYHGTILDLTKAIELNSDYDRAYFWRGLAKYELANYDSAVQDFTKAIALKPDYADAYYYRGINRFLLNDINGACLDWSKADELDNLETIADAKVYDYYTKNCK